MPKDSNAFPLPLTMELLQRGQERYAIFCTPCHGIQGDGLGMVAMRGMKHPPSYHQERLRARAERLLYDVVTNGFGAMYGYSSQIPPRDRWAIIAYMRALQVEPERAGGRVAGRITGEIDDRRSGEMSAEEYKAPASVDRVQRGGLLVGWRGVAAGDFWAMIRRRIFTSVYCSATCGCWD